MSTTLNPSLETDRVRRYTSAEVLRQIERQIEDNVKFYSVQPPHIVSQRIEELKHEWSIERYLQINVATVGLVTALFALTRNRAWALLTCGALGFFLYHGLRGFDPPLLVLRRMGIRTRGEIDREIFALKVARGDFEQLPGAQAQPASVPGPGIPSVARDILAAVNR